MRAAKSTGRLIGALLLVQLAVLTPGFILLMPIRTSAFLENAAGTAFQIRVAVLLLFANGVLTIGIALAAFPVLREYSYRMALWLLAFSIFWFSMQAVDNAHILSMLSLKSAVRPGRSFKCRAFRALGEMLRSTRRGRITLRCLL